MSKKIKIPDCVISITQNPDARRHKEMQIFDKLPENIRKEVWDHGVKVMRSYLLKNPAHS